MDLPARSGRGTSYPCWVWDSPDEIDFESLPDSFVMVWLWLEFILVLLRCSPMWRARQRLREWLGLRQAMKGNFELHYSTAKPRISEPAS